MNKKDILDLAQREKRDEGEDAMENKSRRIGSLAVIFLCLWSSIHQRKNIDIPTLS